MREQTRRCRLEEAFRQELFRLIDQHLSSPEDATLGKIVRTLVNSLAKANAFFNEWPTLKETRNCGLLAALLYYILKSAPSAASFVRWALENHLIYIPDSPARDFTTIFDMVLESRKRTIFVSMPFGKSTTENHFRIVERVCKDVSEAHNLKPALKAARVDWFLDGTSYIITDKINQMISDCGLLIGDLTYGNANVYHEIGFVMGKARAEGMETPNILLFLDESVADEKDKVVAFNLRGMKQLRFTETEKFADALRVDVERFFKL